MDYIWSCPDCGRQHTELPTCWRFGPPASYQLLPADEVARRAELTDDVCLIDDTQWFIRGGIEIPILGSSEQLIFDVWTSLSHASMRTVHETWDDADRAREGPFFGWLNTEVTPYPRSLSLPTAVHIRPPGIVPSVVLHPSEHPLAEAQHHGVPLARVIEIAEMLLPRH